MAQPAQQNQPPALYNRGPTQSAESTVYQEMLHTYLQQNNVTPIYQAYSDRRGGRTAWTCGVTVRPGHEIRSRFWYDGEHINNAREDAAELMLQQLGRLPKTGVPPAPTFQQQQQQQQGQQWQGAR